MNLSRELILFLSCFAAAFVRVAIARGLGSDDHYQHGYNLLSSATTQGLESSHIHASNAVSHLRYNATEACA